MPQAKTTYSPEVYSRYATCLVRCDNENVPIRGLIVELEWLAGQDLQHARPGFDYWYHHFRSVVAMKHKSEIDRFIRQVIMADTEYHCTNLNTVAAAMHECINAVRQRLVGGVGKGGSEILARRIRELVGSEDQHKRRCDDMEREYASIHQRNTEMYLSSGK